jgi:hypothetical protein
LAIPCQHQELRKESGQRKENALNQADGERSVLMQARDGSDLMAKRDHWNYTLRDGRKVVKHGITSDPCQRFTQMKNKRRRFTSMCLDPVPVTKKTALKRERNRIQTYQKTHKGRKPRYNKA